MRTTSRNTIMNYTAFPSGQPHMRAHGPHYALRALLSWMLVLLLLAATLPQHVFALSTGDLTFTLVTPFLPVDSNSPCSAGPKAIYIEVLVTNPAGGVGALNNLTANLNPFI